MSFIVPWERYTKLFKFISFFADDHKEINKKLLTDLLFLSSIDESKPEYDFSFYAHGIYSDLLEMDLEMLENFHAILIDDALSPKIKLVAEAPFVKETQLKFDLGQFENKLIKIKELTAGRKPKELELISSLFFIEKDEKDSVQQKRLLQEIKPNISAQLLDESFSWFTEIQKSIFSFCRPELTASS